MISRWSDERTGEEKTLRASACESRAARTAPATSSRRRTSKTCSFRFNDSAALSVIVTLSYGPNLAAMWRQSAIIVAKLLKGIKPSDLPAAVGGGKCRFVLRPRRRLQQQREISAIRNLRRACQSPPPSARAHDDHEIRQLLLRHSRHGESRVRRHVDQRAPLFASGIGRRAAQGRRVRQVHG